MNNVTITIGRSGDNYSCVFKRGRKVADWDEFGDDVKADICQALAQFYMLFSRCMNQPDETGNKDM